MGCTSCFDRVQGYRIRTYILIRKDTACKDIAYGRICLHEGVHVTQGGEYMAVHSMFGATFSAW